MSRKYSLPKYPDSYLGKKAEEYNDSTWMERNQKKTTLTCISYLFDQKLETIGNVQSTLGEHSLLLDLGCGTGFSSEMLVSQGFNVVAIDILLDMLNKMRLKKELYTEYDPIELVLADINCLPFRRNMFDGAISVSAYNFITHNLKLIIDKKDRLFKTARWLFMVLKPFAKLIIEFYPRDQKELDLFNLSFIKNGFKGYYIKSDENQKGGQTFLLLKKSS